jgi:hypothetical protein
MTVNVIIVKELLTLCSTGTVYLVCDWGFIMMQPVFFLLLHTKFSLFTSHKISRKITYTLHVCFRLFFKNFSLLQSQGRSQIHLSRIKICIRSLSRLKWCGSATLDTTVRLHLSVLIHGDHGRSATIELLYTTA